MTSIAVISDIHGNRWALEAVLEDIQRRNLKNIVNLGDSLYGPLDPSGTASILLKLNVPTVCGNEDRIIIEGSDVNTISPTLKYVRDRLSDIHLNWLKSLNMTESINGDIFMFHGTPVNDKEYFIYTVQPTGLIFRAEKDLNQLLQDRSERIILCGHDHLPNVLRLGDSRLIIDPGSVGLPAYEDDEPYSHVVENGSPHAKYCTISEAEYGYQVEHFNIPYDYQSACHKAKENHRLDWYLWLKTGRAAKTPKAGA